MVSVVDISSQKEFHTARESYDNPPGNVDFGRTYLSVSILSTLQKRRDET